MSYPVTLPFAPSRAKHRASKVRDFAKRAVARVSVPKSIKKLAEMPMTLMGLGVISAGVIMLTTVGGLMFIGVALIGLEYLIADE